MHRNEQKIHTAIGAFVFGAFILSVCGMFFLYNQYLYGTVKSYVMFFKGSLNGLDVTSPITYRGVKIGQVERIELTANKNKSNVAIPVYVNFFVEKSFVQKDNPIDILIENGIVANISSPNILTGKANIELSPGTTKQLPELHTFHGYVMFPTENTSDNNDTLMNDALRTARKTLRDVSNFINSKELQDSIVAFKNMANSFNNVAKIMTIQLPDSLTYFDNSLNKIIQSAQSIGNLTNYLSRHPESLLHGRL